MKSNLSNLRKLTHTLIDRDIDLKFKNKRMEKIIKYSPIAMSLVSLEGFWLDPNPAYCELLGYTYDELIQRTWMSLTHDPDVETDVRLVDMLKDGVSKYYYMKKRYIHKSGKLIPVLLITSPIKDENGNIECFLAQALNLDNMRIDIKEAGYEPTTGTERME